MGTRSIRKTLKEARLKAGLSQSDMAEGICSMQALSRIETGVSGVSHETFRALMARAGAPGECLPVFADRDDFECFHTLKESRFYVDIWQLDTAFELLGKAESSGWADNRLYYQEWLYLHCRLQFRSCCYNHSANHDRLLEALHVTRSHIDLSDLPKLLLSRNEIQILTALAQEMVYLGAVQDSLRLCADIRRCIDSRSFTQLEKDNMLAELAIVQVKCLISLKEYTTALETADRHQHSAVLGSGWAFLLELTFLTGLCGYYTDSPDAAAQIKAAFYSAYAIDSSYAAACLNYLLKETDFPVSEYMRSLPPIPPHSYPVCRKADISGFGSGIFDISGKDALPLGKLIRVLRTEQNLSQAALCHGLCSTSKLSKIENGILQPDLALTEVLLQRLGLSERIFSFEGNERDARIYELKFKIIHTKLKYKEQRLPYIDEMEKLLKADDIIYRQTYLLEKALMCTSPEEKIAGLTEALLLTMPDFDIYGLLRFRLSWAEWTILNNMLHEYRLTDRLHLSILYTEQILKYTETASLDSPFLSNLLPYTYQTYCHCLFTRKVWKDMVSFHSRINLSLLRSNMNAYGSYLFLYSQALGECSQLEDARLAATEACSIMHMLEYYKNAAILKQGVYDDFSIEVDY